MRILGLDALQLRDDTQLPPDAQASPPGTSHPAPVFDFWCSAGQ